MANMFFHFIVAAFIASFYVLSTSALAISKRQESGLGSQEIAVYWGQNSYGQATGPLAQKPLSDYCEGSNIDIIPIAFLYQLTSGIGGEPVINLANQQNNCTTFNGTELIDCPEVGRDIKTCQKAGKKILISIGGATYTEGGFQTEEAAVKSANQIWSLFGPATEGSLRPFGDAVIDGFDFDFESTVSNIIPFARRLRALMAADSSKEYMLTAAPQCVFPDAADSPVLNSDVAFDALFIQFYNNFCGLQSFVPGASTQNNFNFDVWDSWAKNTSANKDIKLFIGVPGGQTAAGSGYTPASGLEPIINYAKSFSSFGGVMMWDASQAYANTGFLHGVRAALGGSSSSTTSVSLSSTAATSTSSLLSTSASSSLGDITSTVSLITTTTTGSTTTTTIPTSTSSWTTSIYNSTQMPSMTTPCASTTTILAFPSGSNGIGAEFISILKSIWQAHDAHVSLTTDPPGLVVTAPENDSENDISLTFRKRRGA